MLQIAIHKSFTAGSIKRITKTPVMPRKQADNTIKMDWPGEVLQQPQWCQPYVDSEELHKFIVIT